MQVPLQITFRHMPTSPALERRVRALAASFERFSTPIVHCRVLLEEPRRHRHQTRHFGVRIELTVPDRVLLVEAAPTDDPWHEDPCAVLHDAFRAARRRLQDYERERRRSVQARGETARGRVCEIDPNQG